MRRMSYLCGMETMIEKFCQRYKLPERTLRVLLSSMEERSFPKGELVVAAGERNANFYLLKRGIWREYALKDGVEHTLWFAGAGDAAFSSWGYVENRPSPVYIEAVTESVAYMISRPVLETLYNESMEMANFGRRVFEQEILSVDNATLAFGAPTAKERYLTLLEANPELLRHVPLKHLASYLYITPQSLSRIRAGLFRKKK